MSSLSLSLSSSLSMSSSLLTKGKGKSHNYLVGRGSSEQCPLCPINYLYYVANPDGFHFLLSIYRGISIIMDRQQYANKHINLNIHQAEIDRKWALHMREQQEIDFALRMSQSASSMVGASLWEELLYMSIDYMDDELNYVG